MHFKQSTVFSEIKRCIVSVLVTMMCLYFTFPHVNEKNNRGITFPHVNEKNNRGII